MAVSARRLAHRDALRDGARRVAGRRRVDPGDLSDREEDRHPPDPLQHRADGGRRHRAVPSADRGRSPDGAALRGHLGRPPLPRVLALPHRADGGPDGPDPVSRADALPAAARRTRPLIRTPHSSKASSSRARDDVLDHVRPRQLISIHYSDLQRFGCLEARA